MITSALARHRAGRGLAAAVLGGVLAVTVCAAAAPASADSLDDGGWWRTSLGVDELQRSGTGKGVTVALIDGPIDSSVPELRGRVASSTTECLAQGGGFEPATIKGVAADHATSMASLIVGSGKGTAPGGRGVAGIAPDATLRHYAVGYRTKAEPDKIRCGLRSAGLNNGSEAIARAIQQAVKDGAKVISISLSSGFDDHFIPALLDAYRAGAIIVASTNNETREVFWPGSGNGVVTVTHVDANGNLDNSAVRNSTAVDFAAPGTKVAAGRWTPSGWKSDVLSDGSSQATAITAGGLAAVWSAHPDATGNQVLQAAKDAIGIHVKNGKYVTWFRRVGENLPKATGKTQSYGFGIMSPADAVKLPVESLPDTNPMINEKGVSMPTAEEISTATGAASTATPSGASSGSPSVSTGPSPTTAPEASKPSTEAKESSSSMVPWLLGGAILLAGLAAVAFFLRRARQAPQLASGDQARTPAQTHDDNDNPAAADGAAATTKERSDGQN